MPSNMGRKDTPSCQLLLFPNTVGILLTWNPHLQVGNGAKEIEAPLISLVSLPLVPLPLCYGSCQRCTSRCCCFLHSCHQVFISSGESSLCYLLTYQTEHKLCQYVAQGHFQLWRNLLVLLEGNKCLYSKVNILVLRTNIPRIRLSKDVSHSFPPFPPLSLFCLLFLQARLSYRLQQV